MRTTKIMIGCFVAAGLCVMTIFVLVDYVVYRYELPSKCSIVKVDGIYYARELSDEPFEEAWHEEITETQANAQLATDRWVGILGGIFAACFLTGSVLSVRLKLIRARMPWE